MQMASGVQFIKGTITPTSSGLLTINFGKQLNDYILFIEMTDESINNMVDSGISSNYKGYLFLGKKAQKGVGSADVPSKTMLQRLNMSNITLNSSTSSSVIYNNDNFQINCGDISQNTPSYLFIGYTYNYTVIPFE